MSEFGKVAVFGAGSWGTAFSIVLADAGNDVTIWARRDEVAQAINDRRENAEYLPGVELPPSVRATHDVAAALEGADVVVWATPSQSFRENLREWAPHVPQDAVMVSLMKGVELSTLNRMSEVIAQETGAGPERIAVISGPNLAKEIARREPAAAVVACADEAVATRLQQRVHSPAFRPYTSVDVLGCELGGAYKNVVGLAVGMAVGLGFGDNTTASIITRGLAETARLAMKLGANPLTLMGLAGLGDLVATSAFWTALGETLRGWAIGLSVAAGAAVVVGLVIGSQPWLRALPASTVEFLRPIPSVALIPMAVLLYGTQMQATLILVVYAAFWQMLVQVLYGVQDVDPVARDTARSFRFGTVRRVRSVLWPTALPYVMTGFRLAAAVALVLEITGELIIGSPGLGRLLASAQSAGAVDTMFAVVLVTGLLGILVNLGARAIERRTMRWHPSQRRDVPA